VDNSTISYKSHIEKLTYFFIDLEKKHDLLEWEIDGVLAWQSARIALYMAIRRLVESHAALSNRQTILDKFKVFYKRAIINSIIFNPFLDFTRSDALVFESGRKYFVDDKYIDIYTKYFCDDLAKDSISHTKYGTNYVADDLAVRSFKVKHIDFIVLASQLISYFINTSISKNDTSKIKIIENEINAALSIKIELGAILINEIKKFKSQYPFYKLLFKIKKPRDIYLTDSPSKAPLIKAAKDCNVTVSEFQHGLIVKEELVSNFPETKEDSLYYFPNKFLLWDNLNACTAKIPLSNKNIVYFKNKHLEFMRNKCQDIPRKEKQILIIAQITGFDAILDFVLNNTAEMKEWQFIYKLPAGQTVGAFVDASNFNVSEHKNLKVIGNEQSLYPFMAESKYAIGVYSTGLIEASYFGCEVLLLNLPGVEQASILIEQNKAKLINANERLLDYL